MDRKSAYERMLAEMEAVKHRPQRRVHSDEEHEIQCSCIEWFRYQYRELWQNLFAVPNGGFRSKATAGRLKAEGVLPGVADIVLLKRNCTYGALLVEMKTAKGVQSKSQKEWQSHVEKYGYKYVVCRSLEDFQREVNEYLKQ